MNKADWKKSYIYRLTEIHGMASQEAKENFNAIPEEDLKDYIKSEVDPEEAADDEFFYMLQDSN